jgi:hypothetical protein
MRSTLGGLRSQPSLTWRLKSKFPQTGKKSGLPVRSPEEFENASCFLILLVSTLLVAALILSLTLVAAPVILIARLRVAAALLILPGLRGVAGIVALVLALFVAILLCLLLIALRLPALLAGIPILVRHWDASTLEMDFSGMVSV